MTDANDPMILEQLAKLNDKMNSQGERLAVQDNKLDTIQTTLNMELRHLKETVERNHTDHAHDIDHLRKGQSQLVETTTKSLAEKVGKEDFNNLQVEVRLKADAKSLLPWQDGLKTVVVAVILLIIGGSAVFGAMKSGQQSNAPAQQAAPANPPQGPARGF